MLKFFEKILAELALVSAGVGAGLASVWNVYQPKEPKNISKK